MTVLDQSRVGIWYRREQALMLVPVTIFENSKLRKKENVRRTPNWE